MSNIFGSESGQAVPGGNLTKPLVIALLALLASRYMAGGGQKDAPAPEAPRVPRNAQGRVRRKRRLPAACSMALAV